MALGRFDGLPRSPRTPRRGRAFARRSLVAHLARARAHTFRAAMLSVGARAAVLCRTHPRVSRVFGRRRASLASSRGGRVAVVPNAYVRWLLDKPGCAAARCGDETLIPNAPNAEAGTCPPKPIDIRALCASEGECVLGNARFLVDGDTLFLQALAPADVVPGAAPATNHPRDPDAFRSTEEPSLRSSTSSASHADESCDREVEIAPGDVVCADLHFDDDDDAFRVPVSPKPNPKAETLEPSPAEDARACGDDDERVAEAEDRDAVRIAEGTSSPVSGRRHRPAAGRIRLEPGAIVELAIGKGGGTYLYEVNRQVHAHA